MAQLNSAADFKQWILTELGSPVITIELADAHLQQALDEAVLDFTRYNYNEGNYRDFLALNLSAGISTYDLSGAGVSDVVDMIMSVGGQGNINMLFTPSNMILGPMDFVKLSNFMIVDWHIAMMKLAEINEYFTVKYIGKYNSGSQTLKVVPTPTENSSVMMEIYKKESAINLYNNQLVKKLALAKAMMIWGRILGKYTITLPGGGTLSGPEIKADAKDLYEEAIGAIKNESEPPGFFVA
jgi:hypothetical protein